MNIVREKEIELGREEVCRKNLVACGLEDLIEQEILSKDKFSTDGAITLGCDLIARHCEAVLHNEDRMTIEVEATVEALKEVDYDIAIPWQDGVGYEWVHGERVLMEAVLTGATMGDYRGVKLWLFRRSKMELQNRHIKLGSGIQAIAFQIPDFGPPYDLPDVAWTLTA